MNPDSERLKPRSLIALAGFCWISLLPFAGANDEVPSERVGVRMVSAGHSFHVFMPEILGEVARSAGFKDHIQLATSHIGGSQLIRHWKLSERKDKIKSWLVDGKADFLTLAPIFLPDEGIGNFVELGLAHNPDLKITVQEFWMPYDDPTLWATKGRGMDLNRDSRSIEDLRKVHEEYFKTMDEHVEQLNARFGKKAVFVVPVGQAVLALRELIIRGEAPGIGSQNDLFKDDVGHPREHIKTLAAYCHFSVIYGRSAEGLPRPTSLTGVADATNLNLLLQRLAWEAVSKHPLAGVR
jgi:hypothetical protein